MQQGKLLLIYRCGGHIGKIGFWILDKTYWDFGYNTLGFLGIFDNFEEKKLDFWRFLKIFGLFMDIWDFLKGRFSFVNKYQSDISALSINTNRRIQQLV